MTIRFPKYAKGEIIDFNGTPGELAANTLTHAWVQEKNPYTKEEWARKFGDEKYPKTLGRCSKCNALARVTREAGWQCGEPRRADKAIW